MKEEEDHINAKRREANATREAEKKETAVLEYKSWRGGVTTAV